MSVNTVFIPNMVVCCSPCSPPLLSYTRLAHLIYTYYPVPVGIRVCHLRSV